MNKLTAVIINLGLSTLVASCTQAPSKVPPLITIDGSSTVYPITKLIIQEFKAKTKEPVNVKLNFSGTGGGFSKFCQGETVINNASRPIKTAEMQACKQTKIAYIELPIAFDALTIVVNKKNDWLKIITVQELKQMWQPEAEKKITNWQQINSSWKRGKAQINLTIGKLLRKQAIF